MYMISRVLYFWKNWFLDFQNFLFVGYIVRANRQFKFLYLKKMKNRKRSTKLYIAVTTKLLILEELLCNQVKKQEVRHKVVEEYVSTSQVCPAEFKLYAIVCHLAFDSFVRPHTNVVDYERSATTIKQVTNHIISIRQSLNQTTLNSARLRFLTPETLSGKRFGPYSNI